MSGLLSFGYVVEDIFRTNIIPSLFRQTHSFVEIEPFKSRDVRLSEIISFYT